MRGEMILKRILLLARARAVALSLLVLPLLARGDTPDPATLCAGTTVGTVAGTAICQGGSTSSPAGASDILTGKGAWDSSGTLMTGSMPDRGALDASSAFPGAGFYDGTVTHLPSASQIGRASCRERVSIDV